MSPVGTAAHVVKSVRTGDLVQIVKTNVIVSIAHHVTVLMVSV